MVRNVLRLQLIVLAFLGALGCVASIAQETKLDFSKIDDLKEPITIGDIERLYGVWDFGHGPYVWYPLNEDEDAFFFFQPAEVDELYSQYSKKGERRDERQILNRAQLLFVVRSNNKDSEKDRVVWPKKYAGKSMNEAAKALIRLPK